MNVLAMNTLNNEFSERWFEFILDYEDKIDWNVISRNLNLTMEMKIFQNVSF